MLANNIPLAVKSFAVAINLIMTRNHWTLQGDSSFTEEFVQELIRERDQLLKEVQSLRNRISCVIKVQVFVSHDK